MTDDELIAIALRQARAMGYAGQLSPSVIGRDPLVRVLLADPAYARGGGLTVVVDPATGTVVDAIRQL